MISNVNVWLATKSYCALFAGSVSVIVSVIVLVVPAVIAPSPSTTTFNKFAPGFHQMMV